MGMRVTAGAVHPSQVVAISGSAATLPLPFALSCLAHAYPNPIDRIGSDWIRSALHNAMACNCITAIIFILLTLKWSQMSIIVHIAATPPSLS